MLGFYLLQPTRTMNKNLQGSRRKSPAKCLLPRRNGKVSGNCEDCITIYGQRRRLTRTRKLETVYLKRSPNTLGIPLCWLRPCSYTTFM